MLTSDPIYYKSLRPKITILNYNNSSTFYAFDPFTGTITTGPTSVFPVSCNVSLSQNGHGSFTVQIEDQNELLDRDNITVGSRVLISCGKQSSQITKLISGVVRVPGFDRGKNNNVIYNLSGPSTGIRLNERVVYVVSQAAKLATGQIDVSDASRKADTLLETTLTLFNSEGVITTGGTLASTSDVETFVADTSIEYGEAQDFVNYIEDLSGGELIVNVDDLIRFRNEMNVTVGGKGFTIKNEPYRISQRSDDADDTMYLKGGSWKIDWEYNKDSGYANTVYGILSPEAAPSLPLDLGGFNPTSSFYYNTGVNCVALKFTPTHAHCYANDFFVGISEYCGSSAVGQKPFNALFALVADGGSGTPNGKTPIVCLSYPANSLSQSNNTLEPAQVVNEGIFFDGSTGAMLASQEISLDTTKDYWIVMTSVNTTTTLVGAADAKQILWWYDTSKTAPNAVATASATAINRGGPISTVGTGWTVQANANPPLFKMPIQRSISFNMWDPKGMRAIAPGVGTGAGLRIDTVFTDMAANIRNKESVYPYLSQKLYDSVLPRMPIGMPIVTAPNVPIFPGDPIIISDKILGLSSAGGQFQITRCGDMTYNWEIGRYEAPTLLSINPIGLPSGYRGF